VTGAGQIGVHGWRPALAPALNIWARGRFTVVAEYLFTRFLFELLQLGADIRIRSIAARIGDVFHHLADDVLVAGLLQIGDNHLFGIGIQLGLGFAQRSPSQSPKSLLRRESSLNWVS